MFRLDAYIFVIFVTSEKKSKYLNKIQRKATKKISKVHICWTTIAQFKPLEILSSEQLISYSKGQCHKNGMVFYHMRCCVNWSYIFPILRQRSTTSKWRPWMIGRTRAILECGTERQHKVACIASLQDFPASVKPCRHYTTPS